MVNKRHELHDVLKKVLGTDYVYFQPPANILIKYPCIVYKRKNLDSKYADNLRYCANMQYEVTIIDRQPDSAIIDFMLAYFPTCKYDTHFVSDNLNHDVFTVST